MAGDWIKVEHVTPDKPEVIDMSEALGIDQDAVFGKLCRLWIWADQQSLCDAASVTEMFVDRKTRVTGFANAMAQAGWLIRNGDRFTFPNFDRHNGQTCKQRALTSKRMDKMRYARSVTKTSPEGEGEGEKSMTSSLRDETGRAETPICEFDWGEARILAKRFTGLGLASKPQDKSLVLKTSALACQGRIPRDWLETAVEAIKAKPRKNPGAYLTALLKTKAKEAGLDYRRLLAETPEPPQ